MRLNIPKEASESKLLTPTMPRRAFLWSAAGVAASIHQLLAEEKVDVSKLSPNELLEKLPERLRFPNDEVATIEKYKAKYAKYLMIVLRNVHKHPDKDIKLHANAIKAIEDSDKENGQILEYLRKKWKVRYVGIEGVIEENLPVITRQRDQFYREFTRIKQEWNSLSPAQKRDAEALLKEAKKEYFSVIQIEGAMESFFKKEIELFPIEKKETNNAIEAKDATPRKILDKREEVCLELSSKHLNGKTNRAVCVWGANHWQIDLFSGVPRSLHYWNIHPRHNAEQFSMAIITPPSVKKFNDAEKK